MRSRSTPSTPLGIPTLADVLLAVGRRVFLDIELKVDPGPDVAGVLAAGRGPGLTDAIVSSFDPVALERVAQLAPAWPRWLNSQALDRPSVALAVELGCRAVAVDWRSIDVRSDGAWRGRPVSTWRRGPCGAGRRSTAWRGSGSSRSASRPARSTADRLAGESRAATATRPAWRRAYPARGRTEDERGGTGGSRGPGDRRRRHDRRLGVGLRGGGGRRPGDRRGARPGRRRRLVAGGRDGPRAGRDAGDGRPRTLEHRLLQRPAGRLRHRFGLPRAGLPDPGRDRGGRGRRPGARRDAAGRRSRRRPGWTPPPRPRPRSRWPRTAIAAGATSRPTARSTRPGTCARTRSRCRRRASSCASGRRSRACARPRRAAAGVSSRSRPTGAPSRPSACS